MEDNRLELAEQLTKAWEDLRHEMKRKNKVRFDAFEDVFTKTYQLFSEHSGETALDKKYIGLIVSASLFANSQNPESDFTCSALFSLTERMLACCALGTSEKPVEGTNVYIFEARKEMYIDFTNVRESVNKLAVMYRENYWDCH